MRPIIKPSLGDSTFAIPPSALLLQSFGEYCSVSEQPLPSNHYVWHKRLGVDRSAPVSRTYWANLLLLCENSFLAQVGKAVPLTLLYPDETPLTFSFYGPSPFKYTLQPVETTAVDENGESVGRPIKSDEVIVSGTTVEAEETIAFFALNSQFFDARLSRFTIPVHAHRIGFDRRVRQRTKAWQMAVAFARDLSKVSADGSADFRTHLLEQGRALAAATGYWSTWASALLHEQVATTTVTELLLPVPPSTPWHVGPGFHNPFPGTNPSVAP